MHNRVAISVTNLTKSINIKENYFLKKTNTFYRKILDSYRFQIIMNTLLPERQTKMPLSIMKTMLPKRQTIIPFSITIPKQTASKIIYIVLLKTEVGIYL